VTNFISILFRKKKSQKKKSAIEGREMKKAGCGKGKKNSRRLLEMKLDLEEDEVVFEPDVSFSFPFKDRMMEHALRTDGLLQCKTFWESVGHLPFLNKDMKNLLEQYVKKQDPLFLFGGIEYSRDVKIEPTNRAFKLVVETKELIELCPMDRNRFQAGAVFFEGEKGMRKP
jgi:hypothetical protein